MLSDLLPDQFKSLPTVMPAEPKKSMTRPPTKARLDGLDLARYFAFVGMVVVNFKVVMSDGDGSYLLSQLTGVLEGRAAATFVVIAGIGLGLAGAKNVNRTISVTTKRAVFLLVLGLANTIIFDADIIHYYAFYFFFGMLLLPCSNRLLVIGIVLLNVLSLTLILTLNYDLGWNWEDYSYADFWTLSGFMRNLFFNGWHPVIPWLGFLLFGVVVSRLSLSERPTQRNLIFGGVLAIAVAEGLSAMISPVLASIDIDLAILGSTQPVPPVPLYMLAGIGASSVVVGFCLMIAEWANKHGIVRVVVPAGRQTLSLYIAHILVGMGTLEAFGMLGGQSITVAVIAAVLFCIVATIYALLWARWFRRGPIETLMRTLAG